LTYWLGRPLITDLVGIYFSFVYDTRFTLNPVNCGFQTLDKAKKKCSLAQIKTPSIPPSATF
jgi:hypothetical protein